MFAVSINVVPSPSGDTVFLAAAGGNNGAGPNTGDAYAYEISVPKAAPAPCFGTFNGDTPLEEVCYTTLLNSTTAKGLSLREYAASVATLVSYNERAVPRRQLRQRAHARGLRPIEYFLGGFNKPKKSILHARTVPFLLLPPGAAGGWAARMALAPSVYPSRAKAPAPLDNVTLVPLDQTQPLTLAVQRASTTEAPAGADFAALCEGAAAAVEKGALPGYSVDPASPFAAGVYALFYGRDAPQSGPFVSECWLGVQKS